jgi:predicted kinase
MARSRAHASFYNSAAWRKARLAYLESVNHICERCGAPAKVVHHRRYITAENLGDPHVTLDHANLEALCQDCHNKEHHRGEKVGRGITFDESGNLVSVPDVFIVVGAPGSGKSSYVREHMEQGDIVFDLNSLCVTLMGAEDRTHADHGAALAVALDMREAFYSAVEHRKGRWLKAWIITSTSDDDEVSDLARRLEAEVVTIDATLEDCIRHIQADETRTGKAFYVELARAWYRHKRGPERECIEVTGESHRESSAQTG